MQSPPIRRQQRQRESPSFTALALAMADIMAMILIMVVLKDPAFGVQHGKLAPLRLSEESNRESLAARESFYRILVDPAGATYCNDQPVPLDQVVEHARADSRPGQRILLVVETEAGGAGALAAYLQLQNDFTERNLWDRVVVPFRRSQSEIESKGAQP